MTLAVKKCQQDGCSGSMRAISGQEAATQMLDAFGATKASPVRLMMVGAASARVTGQSTMCDNPSCAHLDLFGNGQV